MILCLTLPLYQVKNRNFEEKTPLRFQTAKSTQQHKKQNEDFRNKTSKILTNAYASRK